MLIWRSNKRVNFLRFENSPLHLDGFAYTSLGVSKLSDCRRERYVIRGVIICVDSRVEIVVLIDSERYTKL